MEIREGDRQGWFNRGKILASLGKYEGALMCYKKAIAIKPDYYEAWAEKGVIFQLLGFPEEAEYCFNQALGVFYDIFAVDAQDDGLTIPGTDEASSCYNQACFQALQGNVEWAISFLTKAIKLNPEKYLSMVKEDSDFDGIEDNKMFKQTIERDSNLVI
jgi:superkiller protein 3